MTGISCRSRWDNEQGKPKTNEEETLVRINKYLVGEDEDKIRAYIKRRNWTMTTSGTGLWYQIYQKGNGAPAKTGKMASINYKVWLLDGTLCYSSDSLGMKKFRIGKGGVEKGLEEGILLMRVGDKARFIMPPHLADGLIGDQDRIPPRSIILYEVELVQISD
jgi:FKBP-type peptidyl-prolyl cis-trans isomerase